jgi:hypothetical protein
LLWAATPTSNGLASGNHLFEAISHGICEAVERDAAALWHLRSAAWQDSRHLDLDTVHDPDCCAVLDKYAQAGVTVAVWDMTTDVGIAAFLCMISERTDDPLHRLYITNGKGCHPTRAVALIGALTEAAQSRLTFIAGSRDDNFRDRYEQARNPDSIQRERRYMDVTGPMCNFQDIHNWDGETFLQDVVWELEGLRLAGIRRVIVVDLTREFQVPVVRVVIPGLEGVCSQPDYMPGARAHGARGANVTIYIFTGPTLAPEEGCAALDAVYLPPVAQGDVYRVGLKRPWAIGIIDGYFEHVPAVWHKEILWAMTQGIHVYGSASMGALRAAELAPFGMEGIGEIFAAYRDGRLEDDDEVAVVHGPAASGYRPMSEAMVNVRYTLAVAAMSGVISAMTRSLLEHITKAMYYPERSYPLVLRQAAEQGLPTADLEALRTWLPQGRVDQKREDALAMLRAIRGKCSKM